MIFEGWKSSDFLPDANIMVHIASRRNTLGEWKR